ncbi:MAG: Ig-like domain-containing protein [Gemmatimonadales bacterium]
MSTEPRNGATDVEIGATVAAAFSVPVDPATLTASTFTVNLGGARLAAPVSYDAATRTARTPAPLLPGQTYEAILGTAVRGTDATALTQPHRWSFGTRAWRAVELDRSGISTFFSSLTIDATARRHVTFGSRARLLYGTCAAECDTPANWQTLAVEDGSGGVTSVAVDPEGRVHVSYYDATRADLRYAVCASACTTLESWQSVAVDETGDVGFLSSLVVDPASVRHIAYYDAARRALRYATCASGCTTAANWALVTVDSRDDAGRSPSIAVDGAGRLHLAYYAGAAADLRYATCALGCGLAANWQSVTVDQLGDVGAYASLALGPGGGLHVSYVDAGAGRLKYATCRSGCGTAANWRSLAVDPAGAAPGWTSIAVDAFDRVHVSHHGGEHLKYATCATACTEAFNWQAVESGIPADSRSSIDLVVDAAGRVGIATAGASVELVYIE